VQRWLARPNSLTKWTLRRPLPCPLAMLNFRVLSLCKEREEAAMPNRA
jgi:hypothetical protein